MNLCCVYVRVWRNIYVMTNTDLVVRWDCVDALRQVRELTDDRAFIEAMGISQASYSRVTNGKQRPGTRFIAALCNALDVKPNAITEVVGRAA